MRSVGRRKSDRYPVVHGGWRTAAAMLLGAVLATYGLSTSGCGGGTTVSGPTTAEATPAPVAAAPAPVATPAAAPAPGPNGAFELSGEPGACLVVTYNGDASAALVETSRRGFDEAVSTNKRTDTIPQGKTLRRCFAEACIEGDAEQINVKPIGGIWFDINQNPFTNPEKNQDKVAACRARCVAEWKEGEPEYGDWEDYSQAESFGEATVDNKCYKTQRRKKIIREHNACPKESRIKSETWETRQVEIPCPCTYSQSTQSPTKVDFDFEWDGDLDNADVRVEVRGAGAWKLELVASNSNSNSNSEQKRRDGGTIKDSDSVTLDCNSKKELRVSEGDHSWEYWWYRVRLNGVVIFTSARYSE